MTVVLDGLGGQYAALIVLEFAIEFLGQLAGCGNHHIESLLWMTRAWQTEEKAHGWRAEVIDIVQIDACRMGGLNEVLAVLLMAAKYGKPVWPHAGGVGLCEYVQHLSMIDYVAVSGTKDGRVIEYVDHLHEHFVDPCVVRNAAYMPPQAPGFSITMKPSSLALYRFRG